MHFLVSRKGSLIGKKKRFFLCLDPNFKIHDTLTVNFQIQTFAHDGLILWIGDSLPESSFTIEIQNRQVNLFR